ncbi:MAG: glucosamine-6-phosphate deaminase [Acutalibacteraceae bacterium]
MKVLTFKTVEEIGAAAGKMFVDVVKANDKAVLGLATGATPVPTYDYMAQACRKGEVSFKNVTTFNLDEYCDLPKEHKNSYYTFMFENLFSKIDVDPANVNFLNGNAPDAQAESDRYAEAIEAAGGIDIQFLGIGRNGHIAFNEPADKFTNNAFKVHLTQSTIEANSIYFDDIPMPHYAMTMGIGSIMRAKKIVLVATGKAKAEAVRTMLSGDINPHCPASILQAHPDCTVILDEDAASLL